PLLIRRKQRSARLRPPCCAFINDRPRLSPSELPRFDFNFELEASHERLAKRLCFRQRVRQSRLLADVKLESLAPDGITMHRPRTLRGGGRGVFVKSGGRGAN